MGKGEEANASPDTKLKVTPIDHPPPPYDAVEIDEFQQQNPSFAPPSAQIKSSARAFSLTLTPPFTPPPSAPRLEERSLSLALTPNFQNTDIFQKPPKFLLYPSQATQEEIKVEVEEKVGRNMIRPVTTKPINNSVPVGFGCPSGAPQNSPENGLLVPVQEPCQPQNHIVINTTPVVRFVSGNMPRFSQSMNCPFCQTPITTQIDYVSGMYTHLVALIVCLLTGCCGCLTYLFDELKDIDHICPQCNRVVGRNKKLG